MLDLIDRCFRVGLLTSFVYSITSLAVPASAATPSTDCAALANIHLSHARVISATPFDAGSFKADDGKALPKLPAFCRVIARSAPSSDSDIQFEVWLPTAGWNGRLWGVGNGNFAGSISQAGLGDRLVEGYAAVATDTGHESDSMDSSWAAGHPEKIADFGHRGVHEAVVNAKRIARALYGRPPSKAYFGSCSNGGREALMEAQRYPTDYDGIIAGAPANAWTPIYIAFAQFQFKDLADPSRRISAAKLTALHDAVLAVCDAQDGVVDGLIENPQQCHFDPAVLACHGAETGSCLTPPQMEAVHTLYTGRVDAGGKALVLGYPLGSEAGWNEMHFGSDQAKSDAFRYMNGFFRDFVFGDPKWDFNNYDMERDGRLATRNVAPAVDSANPDLAKFSGRGGKLILYQGWNDPVIPAYQTIDYYGRVKRSMGAASTDKTVRLFMAPGVEHCAGGPGPDSFGQFSAGSGDPESNMGAALQRWVEHGVAPERIIAAKHKDEDDDSSAILRTRPLCAWPRVARYRGQGNADSADSFDCASP